MDTNHDVTIKDIAKAAKVSHTTVSRALSDSPLVIESTRNRVKEIAQQMGYVPNQIAKGLVTKSTKSIGLIIPNISNPFYPEVEEGIEEWSNKCGFDVLICNSKLNQESERNALVKLYSKRVDGIILSPVNEDLAYIKEILPPSYPLVIVADQIKDESFTCVYTDAEQCGFMATEYLVKIGHKRIAFVGGAEKSKIMAGRYSGYCKALSDNKIEIDPEMVKVGSEGHEAGYQLTRQLLMGNSIPTAIVAYNDVTAIGVMQSIEDFGLKVPNNISVVGTDDITFSNIFRIGLTTVRQEKLKMGQLAAQLLIKKITDSDFHCDQFNELPPSLVIRKSTSGL